MITHYATTYRGYRIALVAFHQWDIWSGRAHIDSTSTLKDAKTTIDGWLNAK